jgi:hypothetical protein
MDDLKPKSASQDGALTYLFRVLGERVVHLDGFLDHVLIGDLEEGEADDLGHLDSCWVRCLRGRCNKSLYDSAYCTDVRLFYMRLSKLVYSAFAVGLPE